MPYVNVQISADGNTVEQKLRVIERITQWLALRKQSLHHTQTAQYILGLLQAKLLAFIGQSACI